MTGTWVLLGFCLKINTWRYFSKVYIPVSPTWVFFTLFPNRWYYGWQFQLSPSETWLLSAMAVTRSTWFMPGLSQWRKFPFLGRQLFPLPTALLEKRSDFQLNRVDWTHINQYAFHQTAQVSFDYTKSETGGVNIVPGWDCRCTLLSTESEYQLVLILFFARGMEKNEFAR